MLVIRIVAGDKSYKPLNLPLNKVSKYKVEGDTDEILEIGETLIHYIETKDFKMFSCLKALIDSGDGGKRFRSYAILSMVSDN